jgi:hypothetical protein
MLLRRFHRIAGWGGFWIFAFLPVFMLIAPASVPEVLVLWTAPVILWASLIMVYLIRLNRARYGFWVRVQETSPSNFATPLLIGGIVGFGGLFLILFALAPGPRRPVPLSVVLIPVIILLNFPLMLVGLRFRDRRMARMSVRYERHRKAEILAAINGALDAGGIDHRLEKKGTVYGLTKAPAFHVLGGAMTLLVLGANYQRSIVFKRYGAGPSPPELSEAERLVDSALDSLGISSARPA